MQVYKSLMKITEGDQWDEHQADTNHQMSVFLEAAIIKSVSAQF